MTSPAATPAPGQLLTFFHTLDAHRRRRVALASLPPRDQEAVPVALAAVRTYMDRDPHVGPVIEGAMDRIEAECQRGTLSEISQYDITVVRRFLLAVPTSVRRGA
jgi:hypothetical protein